MDIIQDTDSIGIFCASLDVSMARRGGWTEDDIQGTWDVVKAVILATNRRVALRRGHTRRCPDCECWTVPTGPCHLCEADRSRKPQSVVRYHRAI